MWGYWVRSNPDIKNIRFFIMLGISNEQRNQLAASCLKKVGRKLSEWPGLTFEMGTDEGRALLGPPNGATFAYFLLQHKAQLGPKTISKVTIIRPENEDENDFVDASLIFHVVHVPPPPPDEETPTKVHVARKKKEVEVEKDMKQPGYVITVMEEEEVMVRVHEFRI